MPYLSSLNLLRAAFERARLLLAWQMAFAHEQKCTVHCTLCGWWLLVWIKRSPKKYHFSFRTSTAACLLRQRNRTIFYSLPSRRHMRVIYGGSPTAVLRGSNMICRWFENSHPACDKVILCATNCRLIDGNQFWVCRATWLCISMCCLGLPIYCGLNMRFDRNC